MDKEAPKSKVADVAARLAFSEDKDVEFVDAAVDYNAVHGNNKELDEV